MTSEHWEEIFIEVTNPANPQSSFNVGNLYRPPHTAIAQLTVFIDYLSEKLALLNTKGNIFVCGDYNRIILKLFKALDLYLRLHCLRACPKTVRLLITFM